MDESFPATRTDTQLYREVFNASPIGIAVDNLDGQPLFVNPAFCSMLGFSEEELRSKHCVDFSPPEDAAKDWTLFQQLRAGSIDHYQLEKRYFRRDGSTVWGRLSISLLNSHPSPLVLAMVEDITASKRLQLDSENSHTLLRESEERLLLAVKAGRMFAYTWHADTDVIERSGQYDQILGVGKGEAATGATLSTMVHPDDRKRVDAGLTQLTRESPNLKITYRMIRPDGAVVWLDRNSHAYFDEEGKLRRIVGMVVDVTERKQAEERLREYEKAVEGAEDMIGVIDRQYRFLLANHQYLKMRNMTREQVVGHFISEIVGKELFEAVIKPKLDECFAGKVVRYEQRVVYPTFGERDLLFSYFPIEGPNGIDRAACILHDITDRKQAQEALSGMTRKLIEAQEQERVRIARELHDDITQRLAMLAVELGQLQHNASDVPTKVQGFRKELAQISKDVQALSHDLHSSKLEYLGVVTAMRSWCQEFSKRQKLEVDFKSDVSSILRSELGVGLFRVLQEALHNAVRHSGVKRVEVQLLEHSNAVHLIVSDSGQGFDVEAALQGKGLGLTSMRERVRLLNGTIAIESKPMSGTTVQVRVPFQSEHKSELAG
jgi:PAS domain S-box-containing protein